MATAATVVTCTHCEAKMKVPSDVLGKKIRCKSCEGVFLAKAEAAPAKPKADGKKAGPAKSALQLKEDAKKAADIAEMGDGDKNPYGVTKEDNDLPRCPFCAKEMPSAEAIICLNCGYNTRTRSRNETKAVFQPTAGDWLKHLAPGILAFLVMAGLITFNVFLGLRIKSWLAGSWFESEDSKPGQPPVFIFPTGIITLWSTIFVLFVCFKLLKIFIKRCFIDYRPTEQKIDDD